MIRHEGPYLAVTVIRDGDHYVYIHMYYFFIHCDGGPYLAVIMVRDGSPYLATYGPNRCQYLANTLVLDGGPCLVGDRGPCLPI